MTYDEITLFRKFMRDKGVLANYEYFYRAHRYDKIELDYFLEQVEAEGAIVRAFDLECADNSIYSSKYWNDLNKKWLKLLSDYRIRGGKIPEAQMQCPHCGRTLPASAFNIGVNGFHKHCRECESGEWDRLQKEQKKKEIEKENKINEMNALEKEIAEMQTELQLKIAKYNGDKTTKVCEHCGKRKLRSEFSPSLSSVDGLQSWCNSCQDKLANISNNEDIKEQKRIEKENTRPASPRLGEYDATLHFKTLQKSITFNGALSEIIMNGNFTKCYLNTDRQQRHFLIFNNVEGANVSVLNYRSSVLTCVYSSDICTSLAKHFNLKVGDSYYLHITRNLSRTKDFITIEVLSYRTKEEFLAAAQRKEEEVEKVEEAPKVESPAIAKPEQPKQLEQDYIHFDFGDKVTAPPTPEELLQQLIDRHLATERDIAAFLHNHGWRLQEPVTSYKKFTL